MKARTNLTENPGLVLHAGYTSYVVAGMIAAFFAALFGRLGFEYGAACFLVVAWSVILMAGFSDRLIVRRRRIVKAGLAHRVASWFTGEGLRLKFSNIEQIDTYAVQRFKRGSSVYYFYRTVISGGDTEVVLHSSQRKFGLAIATILANVPDDVLDNRSLELRDFYADRGEVRLRARESEIPHTDALESSWKGGRTGKHRTAAQNREADPQRVDNLRLLANELRIAGFLVQSMEAFRRAALLQPRNGWLLFEFGRCMLSFAASERDENWERRGFAMLRLAEKRAGRDIELLSRLGESYFQAGNWARAEIAFRKATENIGVTFRSVRGQAEIALREGKLAHVVHNFSIANTLSAARSLKRWTRAEIEYFTRLSNDDEYMELEVSRLSLADTFLRLGNSAVPVAMSGLGVLLTGEVMGDASIADIGWIIAGIAISLWIISRIGSGVLATRIPVDTPTK